MFSSKSLSGYSLLLTLISTQATALSFQQDKMIDGLRLFKCAGTTSLAYSRNVDINVLSKGQSLYQAGLGANVTEDEAIQQAKEASIKKVARTKGFIAGYAQAKGLTERASAQMYFTLLHCDELYLKYGLN